MNDEELTDVLEHCLKAGSFERDDLYLFDTPLAWLMTNEAHVREPERRVAMEAIAAHSSGRELDGHSVNVGSRAVAVTSERLASWLLTEAKSFGPSNAVRRLRDFLSLDFSPCDELLAISGLVLERPIKLAEGIDLIPFSDLDENQVTIPLADPKWEMFARQPDGRIRKRARQLIAGFGRAEYTAHPSIPTAALRITHKLAPKTMSTGGAFVAVPSSLELLYSISCVASAVTCTPVFPVAYWWAPAPIVPCGDAELQYQIWNHADGLRRIAYAVEHETKLIDTVSCYVTADEHHRQRMKVPLERFNTALAAASPVDLAIDMGIALEALLLADLGKNDQPTLAFRLRGAWLLGTSPDQRAKLSREFAAIYSCRSSGVHRGRLDDPVKLDGESVPASDFLAHRGQKTAAAAILKVLKTPKIDWATIVFGGS